VKSIHYKEVLVADNRQRKQFKETSLIELAVSMQKPHGQLQPIVLRNDERTLVCGERRLRAMEHVKQLITHDGLPLNSGHIAYTTLGELTKEQLYEAELEENVQREDLTWQERVAAIAALHGFRKLADPAHTVKATAQEIYGEKVSGRKQQEVQKAIDLAPFLDDVLVMYAPDEKTARKAIKNELLNRERIGRLREMDGLITDHKLFLADALDPIQAYANFFDVILTDPPYGIDIHTKETFDADTHEYDDSDDTFTKILTSLPALAYNATKENAHLYCFCDIRRFTELLVAFELGGWTVWSRPIIWDKGNTGSYGNIEYGFRACYDAILFARKGDKKVTAGYRDVINITQKTTQAHPAGKPVELFSELLKRSVLPGDRVADFFCGSGPIFPAAANNKCIAYGWEINEKYHAMAAESLREAEGLSPVSLDGPAPAVEPLA